MNHVDPRGVTFWLLGESSRWFFTFSSFSMISLIFELTCSDKDAASQRTVDTQMHKYKHSHQTLGSFYLVDPKDHRVLQVKRQLLGGTEVGKTLDTGHHFFYADHLHHIGHHQGINEVDVGALEEREILCCL